MPRFPMAVAVWILLLIAGLLGCADNVIGEVSAHEWYDIACCSGHDCERAPVDAVVDVGNGYWVHAHSARHGDVDEFFPRSEVRQSKDGSFHVCFWPRKQPNGRRLRCLYEPLTF